MTKDEKKIIKSTKEFAKANNIHFDSMTENMILNAMREIVKSKFNNFISEQKNIDPEFVEIVNDNFWDLL